MKNLEIAKILYNIADILELQNIEFKPRAYRIAARGIESLSEDIEELYKNNRLESISGVGKSIAEKIAEYIETGKIKYYQKLKKIIKIDLEELNKIPSLGPKKIKILYDVLKIKNVKELEKAVKKNKIQTLHGFGEETEKEILHGIEYIKKRPQRFIYAHVTPIVNEIITYFKKFDFVKKIEVAGSFRRGKETVGDLDFLVVSNKPEKVMQIFTNLPDVKRVLAQGTTKSSIRLNNELQIDLRVVNEKQFGSALLYFIGNKQHNIEIRKIALSKGYTLSEYGLFRKKDKKNLASKTEKQIYKRLGLPYITPELRENMGEIKAAQEKKIPQLITSKDIKGVFHNHTTWSDGSNSIEEMVKAAEELKLKFISFNDHFGLVKIANPLNEKRLTNYLKKINQVRKKTRLDVLSGVEIDILKDGTLPLSRKKLKQLDVVIAAVHLSINMPEKEMTKRVCFALENYPINILAHPTDRLINRRPGLKINLDKVFQTAKDNQVFLEINSSPIRIDLSAEKVKSALSYGCKIALSTDAHDIDHIKNYKYGVLNARRGWIEKKNILNSWNMNKIKKALEK